MEEILINTGVYGILIMAVMNFVIVYLSYRKRKLDFQETIWLVFLICGISMLAAAVFFRSIMKMNWLYYAAILASLVGLIGMFLRLARAYNK
ncbi:hypothetical protein K6119_05940 [Paracrocinitomix mangrovi]|uniref:hypothetical protein n=1 Tax=Paracrocinitomix mangrovi TaxID=2862509 RepID=UPI001C8DA958|nr:hypothetical protein [Paracrocinitomix mangrovi]UKN03051.1 hypothetical protein K6119_05940 [Paracrocinitomix mangrovi]